MYKHAQKDQENVPSIDEWLSQFDFTALQQMMPVIVELWTIDQKTTSTPKKEKGQ